MKKLFVIGMAVLLLVAFTMPAMAKVKIGGIIFTDFYYLDRNSQNMGGADSYQATTIQLPNITRFYARWTNEDNVGMYIEFGLGQNAGGIDAGSSDDAGSVRIRHAYGWWDVNPMFTIMAGHSTTPFSPLNPSQLLGTRSGSANIIGVGYGDFYSGRFNQVRGTFRFGKAARLEVALVDPNGGNFGPWAAAQNNTKIPRIDIGIPIYAGPVHIYPSLLYQHRTVDDVVPAGVNNDLDTIVGSLAAKAGFGPFGVAAEFNYGNNWGNTRDLIGSGAFNNMAVGLASASLKTVGGTTSIDDAETYSFWIDLSYKFGPITPHLMYGQMKSKVDNAVGANQESTSQMYGISVPIDLAKGFRIRPELMWYDNGDWKTDGAASVDNGKYAIYGIQFQITF